jgi:hypothetical protein
MGPTPNASTPEANWIWRLFTWSHALDEISNGGFLPFGFDSAFNASPTTINPFNLKMQNYGNADYDIRNSLNGDYLINLPLFWRSASAGGQLDFRRHCFLARGFPLQRI